MFIKNYAKNQAAEICPYLHNYVAPHGMLLSRVCIEPKMGSFLGTNAFWEGIDLPGELLEILILAKLPFGVPSEPVIKAYSNLLQSLDKNPFLEFNVPECVIKFRQGFGRLIRTSQDVGAFFVMDERVVKKRYGTSFSDSIPVRMDPFSSLNEIRI